MRKFIGIVFLFSTTIAYGQLVRENNYLTSMASSSSRTNNQSSYSIVDEVHGTLNVTIPLYTLDYAGIKIPITLNYAAEGIRSGQESSEVGLGWSINSVGAIKRRVLGFPDEGKIGKLDYNYTYSTKSGYNTTTSVQLPFCTPFHTTFAPLPVSNYLSNFLSFRRGLLRHGIKPHSDDLWYPVDLIPLNPLLPGHVFLPEECESGDVRTFDALINTGSFDLQPDWFTLSGPFSTGNFFLMKNSDAAASNIENLHGCLYL